MNHEIYADHAATTPVAREVADTMYDVLLNGSGNPSSQYPYGAAAKKRLEADRAVIAAALGCKSEQFVFTSCGSESDNIACDILLREAGGPEAVEAYVRSLGIGGIRIAASEEEMHRGIGNQRVNKARPSSVCTLFDLFLQGRLLKGEYNALLQRLLRGTTTGANKLKAGLPASTVIGHKTGSSDRTAEGIRIADNDVGYVVLPDGRRYCIAVFVTESEENDATNAAIAASASRAAYEYFSSK